MANEALDIAEKLALFTEHWSPKVVARLNDYEIKVVKLKGEFVWHTHDGHRRAVPGHRRQPHHPAARRRRDPGAGQLYVVPRGVEHCPMPTARSQRDADRARRRGQHRRRRRRPHRGVRRLTHVAGSARRSATESEA